jgi:pyruvate,water dikinase
MNEPTWDVGAPGQWAVDVSHMPGGTTALLQEIQTRAMPAGMRRVFADLGTPADTLDARFVNGFFYSRLRPLISPDKPAKKQPPAVVLRIATRLHPEMRRRNRAAQATMREKPWRAVIRDWHGGARAAIVEQNLALQDVDLEGVDDATLVAHAQACIAHCAHSWEHHFWLHGFDVGPIGIYLFEAAEWGLTPRDLLPLLEGASPSTSAPRRELVRIRDLIAATGRTPRTLDEARGVSPEVAIAIDGYLRLHGASLFSRYDLDGVTLGERPDLLLATILAAEPPPEYDGVAALTAAVRERVPVGGRARFEELLHDARDAMDLRDDNGPVTAEWPLGLLRLALLEVGRRLEARGIVASADHALELRTAEITEALMGGGGVGGDELAARAALRAWQKTLVPPAVIGDPELAPPLDVLPPALGRMVAMVQLVIAQMGMDGAERTSGLHGKGVGTSSIRGRACVATSAEEALDTLEPGDILVVLSTTPAYNLVLSLAGGVVTAEGGLMSHAAVLSRELGIPAVIGATGALTDIPHGAEIEVDPVAGEVRVLSVT